MALDVQQRAPSGVHMRLPTSRTRRWWPVAGLLAPSLIWMGLCFVPPLAIIGFYSVLTRGATGNMLWQFTLDNYARLFSDSVYLSVALRSLWMAVATTLICLVLGYPLALLIARCPNRWRPLLLVLVVIPFWTNYLVRTYAWMLILNHNGLINTLLRELGLPPATLINTEDAVLLGLIYGALPFMVLPIYAALDRFDWRLVEAAQDLGAGRRQAFLHVLLPLTAPGIVAGSVLVGIPTIGQFVISDLLGGSKVALLGNLLDHQFKAAQHWPFGSAVAVVCMVVLTSGVIVYGRATRKEEDVSTTQG